MPPLDPRILEDRCREEAAAALRAMHMPPLMIMIHAGITITHHFSILVLARMTKVTQMRCGVVDSFGGDA